MEQGEIDRHDLDRAAAEQMSGFRHGRAPLNQAGYLYEIPLLTVLIASASAALVNFLPAPWNLIPLAVLAAVVAFFLFYNFVCPGWLPGRRK